MNNFNMTTREKAIMSITAIFSMYVCYFSMLLMTKTSLIPLFLKTLGIGGTVFFIIILLNYIVKSNKY